jgi:hypothetical protein
MSLKFNSDLQRIEASGVVQTGNWVSATYSRTGTTVSIVSVGHGLTPNDTIYIDFSGAGTTATDGEYSPTIIDDNNFTITDSVSGVITAGQTCAYRRKRSFSLNAEDNIELSLGTGLNERLSLYLDKGITGEPRVGINTSNPEYELDVDGQIRTTRSIISDTAQILNLDIDTIVNPALNLRAPNLQNFTDTDVTSPTFGQTFYPTADTPPLGEQSRRIATTDFVYQVATNDTGGRVYVSSTIGDDANNGRSAARPVATIKKAAQIAYALQKASPDPTDEYVSIIVSGGEYLEDNPISLPRNCSLIGDNLRRVIVRPLNADRHMIKASNETYVNGVVFRDRLLNDNDPNSAAVSTWKYAFVFDDKQRLYYEPEIAQMPAVPGHKYFGRNLVAITFSSHTGNNTTLTVGDTVTGQTSGTVATVQSVTFTGPPASPYSTGTVIVLITSSNDNTWQDAETVEYDGGAYEFIVFDKESQRPEVEAISNQIYQHTFDTERTTKGFNPSTDINGTTFRLTLTNHRLYTGSQVYYQNNGATSVPGLINNTVYYARVISNNVIELYDSRANAVTTAETEGRLEIGVGVNSTQYLTFGKVMPESDTIYIERHGFKTGDAVIYRNLAGAVIAPLADATQYYVYAVDESTIKLATSAANATAKAPSGADAPITINLTTSGTGFKRFDISSKLLPISTIDTSLTTQQNYNGILINLSGTNFHDYELYQEIYLYGFQSNTLNFGGSATATYSQSGSTITVTVSNTTAGPTSTLWGNLASLGEAGIYFEFTTGGGTSKSYLIDSFVTGTGTPTLPAGTASGLGVARYDSVANTVTFVLKAPDSATRSGNVTVKDNLVDLNGRRFVSHRIERPDGYSLQFATRGKFSNFNSSLDVTGDQTVISACNYVLGSLRNSPYGFDYINTTRRYQDAAETIHANEYFIAEEALGIAKAALGFTVPTGDQSCIDDTVKVLRAVQYDLRYGGNSKTVEAANTYIFGGALTHIVGEEAASRRVYQEARDLCIKAMRNDLGSGAYSTTPVNHNGSLTIDTSTPECANVASAITTLFGIVDTVINTAAVYSGTVTPPVTMITENGGSLYTFPLVNTFLDLPIVEASPYIQNSSVISFLGGNGCEVDGLKVATPNVPRPGLTTRLGQTVAQYDPQAKSMVASAFTIISFGGTGYNIVNDGYTQLVSCFVIFCQDGILAQSGGYASVTNSATNFGTYALRATGYRAEAYPFDIGTITAITNQVDGNGVLTGRQEITVGGTTLTNIPTEDYIIKLDGYTNTNPNTEFIILKTELISGAPGTQIVAKITTNASISYTQNGTGTVRSYANGNLSGLVGATIRFLRPSVVNSSSHTWEFAGSGNTYAALPQNGGVGRGSQYESAEEKYGQVYTSGTNEFGDFKVGNFVTIFNRTGAISFVGTVSISELSSIKIVGGNITITGFSNDDNLGGAFASDSILPTQASVKDYISNNLGPYLNQPYSTNAVPSALVQLTSTGKINIDQIPALRPFNITSVSSTQQRLALEDVLAGDIAIETTTQVFNVAPADVNDGTDVITITSHGLATGDALIYTQGTANIGGLSNNVTYYVINTGINTIKLAVSKANATAGTAIDLTSQGTGTQIFTTQGIAVSYILENDLDSQFLAFTPNSGYSFSNGTVIRGSSTNAQGVTTNYINGRVYNISIQSGGAGYSSAPIITISAPSGGGTQATATASITNGIVTSVTITQGGTGYLTQPTVTVTGGGSPTQVAQLAALIEGRLYVDIANSLKFDSGDFILDGSNTTIGSGTYSQSGTTITVTQNGHGLTGNTLVYLDFTSGNAADGFYTAVVTNANQYTVTSLTSDTTSGNVNRKRIIDLTRVVNTSASDAANWTQLTSTNIDASNIVSGTIDPQRLASRGAANSFTFLRGDSSYEYALQSIRAATSDAVVINASITDSTYIDSITIVNGGSGYTNGTYQNLVLAGGNVQITNDGIARATFIVSGGAITSATVTDAGSFSVVIPTELGAGTGAILTANKGTINRNYGNIEIDIKKANDTTPSATVYGNYGIARFRKDVDNQSVGNQTEGGFLVTANGEVSIDQGQGSKLNADLLDGNEGSFYTNASNLTNGTLDPARLSAATPYNISISGSADIGNRLFNDITSPTSNPGPSGAVVGIVAHLRDNSIVGVSDGGTQAGVLTYRRNSGTTATTQLAFTDNNNLYIRGNSGTNATYSNWFKMWSENNDGSGSGLDADVLDGKQGKWYQNAYNAGDQRTLGAIGDIFLPEVIGRDKISFESFHVNASGNKYRLYIPDFHVNSGAGGNINNAGTYTIYSDDNATNNIGTIVVDSTGGVTEVTDSVTGAIYSLVVGTVTFSGNNTNANIRVFGPNPGSKWTVTSSNNISSGSTTIFTVRNDAQGATIELGKTSVSTTPTLDFRSSGQASDFDVRLRVSGGNATDGQGTLALTAGGFTINGNTIWHAGNDGSGSGLDADTVDGRNPDTTAANNTIALRNGTGDLYANDFYGDQGIFSNTGASILSLADANGIQLGKAANNVLSIQGKGAATTGYVRFGNDTRDLGWNGTHLSYGAVYFRNSRLGVGKDDPQRELHVLSSSWDNTSGGSAIIESSNVVGAAITLQPNTSAVTNGTNGWAMYAGSTGAAIGDGKLGFWAHGTNIAAVAITRTGDLIVGGSSGVSTGTNTANAVLDVRGTGRFTGQITSTVADGTAPFAVTSTTVVTNLNADLLDGYTALNLPYLGATVNTWLNDAGGQERFFFSNNGSTYFRTGDDFIWRNDTDQCVATLTDTGTMTLGGNNATDYYQTTYALEVRAKSGINLNAAEALSSGQKTTVLYATGDKQWIDSYGVFKRNRQTVSENITVGSTDNCMSAGPITINNNITVTISDGGSWSIV